MSRGLPKKGWYTAGSTSSVPAEAGCAERHGDIVAGKYEGPHRHVSVLASESTRGLSVTVVEFEIFKGKRRYKRQWPPILIQWDVRPRSVADLLLIAGQQLDTPWGAQPPSAPPGGPRGDNPQR